MYDIWLDDPQGVVKFVGDLIPHLHGRGIAQPATGIGVTRDGVLVGGFAYNNWQPEKGTIEASAAATDRRWLTPHTLYHLHAYAFDGLGCQMIVTQTSATFTHLLRMHETYGYKLHTIPRLFGRDHDGVITTLTVEDWRASRFTRAYIERISAHGQE